MLGVLKNFLRATLFVAVTSSAYGVSDRELVAAVLVLEAAQDGAPGFQAVASVARNRASRAGKPLTHVLTQPKQFSALNGLGKAAAVARARRDRTWPLALTFADLALAGRLQDTTRGATHYHVRTIRPYWSKKMTRTTSIGGHIFYR
jgi:spore germination cell wall hydrolase CwlJ-like protein